VRHHWSIINEKLPSERASGIPLNEENRVCSFRRCSEKFQAFRLSLLVLFINHRVLASLTENMDQQWFHLANWTLTFNEKQVIFAVNGFARQFNLIIREFDILLVLFINHRVLASLTENMDQQWFHLANWTSTSRKKWLWTYRIGIRCFSTWLGTFFLQLCELCSWQRGRKRIHVVVDTYTTNNHARDRCTGRHAPRVPLEMEILAAFVPSPAPLIAVFCRLFSRALCSALPLPVSLPVSARIGSAIRLTYNVTPARNVLPLSLCVCSCTLIDKMRRDDNDVATSLFFIRRARSGSNEIAQ